PSESEVEPESLTPSRRRRADSKVTSTGMLPIITKRRDDDAPKPRSRREARQQAAQKAAERRADIERSKLNRPPRAKQNQKWCVGQQHHKRHLHLYRLKLHLWNRRKMLKKLTTKKISWFQLRNNTMNPPWKSLT